MSLLDQPFTKQSGCFGCNLNPESSSSGSYDGFVKQHPADQAVMTREDEQRKQEIDVLLSEAMNTLTFDERQEQQAAIHGVEQEIVEESIFVDTALKELDHRLIRIKQGSVYEKAERANPEYVGARAFRIMFLRGNRYDCKAAADQMIRFFEMKQQLFGTERLVKDITIEDLDDDDRESLKAGFVQLAGRDTSSRQIIVQVPGLRNFRNFQNELRASFYTIMQALRSEKTQLKGVVAIMYSIGNFKDRSNGVGVREHTRLRLSLPRRNVAIHCCLDDPTQYILIRAGLAVVNAKLRAQIRVHYGSHLECHYRLSTYGISTQTLPLTATYEVNMHRHLNWVESCLRRNKTNFGAAPAQKTDFCTQPTATDVLYRGGSKSKNAGNGHLRSLVAEWSQIYDYGSNDTKRKVVNEMINEIHRSGGRFLSQVDGQESVWAIVPVDEVRLKITQSFRNRRRKVRGTRKKKS